MRSWLLMAGLLLAGCPKGGGAFHDEFVSACRSSSNLEPAICDCLARKAETDLKEDERSFLLAVLTKNDARAAELRPKLGLEGAAKTGMFLTKAATCAAETAAAGPD
ncbi:MAG: hypothetical protein AB7L66_09750 [Gemmatimonadales bacterium]